MSETMKVYGVKPDGSTVLVGTAPITPAMKMVEIVRDYFGEPSASGDEEDDPDMCLWALKVYHEWLIEQGWTAPKLDITPA